MLLISTSTPSEDSRSISTCIFAWPAAGPGQEAAGRKAGVLAAGVAAGKLALAVFAPEGARLMGGQRAGTASFGVWSKSLTISPDGAMFAGGADGRAAQRWRRGLGAKSEGKARAGSATPAAMGLFGRCSAGNQKPS